MSNPNGKKHSNTSSSSQKANARAPNAHPHTNTPCQIPKSLQLRTSTPSSMAQKKSPPKINAPSSQPPISSSQQPRPVPVIAPANTMLDQRTHTEHRLTKLESEVVTSHREEKLSKIQIYEKLKEVSGRQQELHKQIRLRDESIQNSSRPPNDVSGSATEMAKSDSELQTLLRGISASLQTLQNQIQSAQPFLPATISKTGESAHIRLENRIRNLEEQFAINRRLEKEESGEKRRTCGVLSKSSTLISFPIQRSVAGNKPRRVDPLSNCLDNVSLTKSNCSIPHQYTNKDIQQIIIKLAISLDNSVIFEKLKTELSFDLSEQTEDNDNWKKIEDQKNELGRIIAAEGKEQFALISDYLNAVRQKKIDQEFRLEMERILEQKWYLKEETNKQNGSTNDKEKKSVWMERERIKYIEAANENSLLLPSGTVEQAGIHDVSWEWMNHDHSKDNTHINFREDEEIALDIVRLLEQEERILIEEIGKGKWALTKDEIKLSLDERIKKRTKVLQMKCKPDNIETKIERKKAKRVRQELEYENSKLDRVKIALGKPERNLDLVLNYEKKLQYLKEPRNSGSHNSCPVPAENKILSKERKFLEQLSEEQHKKGARTDDILQLVRHLQDELNQMKLDDDERKRQIESEFQKTHDLIKNLEQQRSVDFADLNKRKKVQVRMQPDVVETKSSIHLNKESCQPAALSKTKVDENASGTIRECVSQDLVLRPPKNENNRFIRSEMVAQPVCTTGFYKHTFTGKSEDSNISK